MATIAEEIGKYLPQARENPRFTRRQVKAIEGYIETGSKTKAGLMAGYKHGKQPRLPNGKIKEYAPLARSQTDYALRKFAETYAIPGTIPIPKEHVTEDKLRANLAAIRDEARAAGQFGPAIRAEELVARSVGLLQDKPTLTADGIEIVIRRRQVEVIDVTPSVDNSVDNSPVSSVDNSNGK